jgi:hypothetical protein
MVAELVETAAAFTELLGLAAIRRGANSSVRSWGVNRSLRAGRKTFRLSVEGCRLSSGQQ